MTHHHHHRNADHVYVVSDNCVSGPYDAAYAHQLAARLNHPAVSSTCTSDHQVIRADTISAARDSYYRAQNLSLVT